MQDAPQSDSRLSSAGVLAIAFAGFCTFLDLYATQPLLPLIQSLFHASKAQAALTVSASTAAVALAAPLVGILAERTPRKRVIVASIVMLAIATLLAATSSGLKTLVLWRFLQGAAIPGMYVLAIAYVTEEAGPGAVGRVMAAFVTGNVIGGFCGRMIAGLVGEHVGWREAFVALGLLNLAGAIATWVWLPKSRNFRPHSGPKASWRERRAALRAPQLLATFAIGFNVLFSLVASFTYVVFYLNAPPFLLGTAALSGIFVVYLFGAVVTPVAGRWIDRAGSRTVLVVSLAAGAAGMALTLIHWLPAVIAGLAISCSAVFVCQSASTSYLRIAAAPPVRSLASGLYVTAYYVGGSVGGLLPGLLWDRAGWPGCVGLVLATQLVTMAVALRWWGAPEVAGSGSPDGAADAVAIPGEAA